MKTLVLLRHAKSSWKDPYLSDHDRPLNKRGKKDAPEMARRYIQQFPVPDLLISSTARRTMDTAKLFCEVLGLSPDQSESDRDLYHADAFAMLQIIGGLDNTLNTVFLVGHNPGMTVLANILQPGLTENLPTCGIAVFEVSDHWSSFLNKSEVRCTGFLTPKSSD